MQFRLFHGGGRVYGIHLFLHIWEPIPMFDYLDRNLLDGAFLYPYADDQIIRRFCQCSGDPICL